MATIPVINYRRYFDSYELNISARKLDSNSPDIYAELVVRTVKLWLYLAKAIQNNLTTLPDEIAFRSVEQSIEEDSQDDTDTNVSFDGFDENRVTIFDWSHSQGDKFKLNMTLHSNSLPQAVLDLYWAMHSAKQTLESLYPTAQNQSTKPSNSSATPTQAITTSKAPENAQNATNEAIVATMRPDSRKVLFVDGQKLIYTINRIVATTFKTKADNKTAPVFEFYSTLSKDYPTLKVYKFKAGTTEISPAWHSVKEIVGSLNLTVERPEADGNWQAVAKATHAEKEGEKKEYVNIVSLTAN